MPEKGKEILKDDIERLYKEKDGLEEQLRKLDQGKIEKLQNLNQELEKRAEWLDKERIKVTRERDNLNRQVKNFRGKKWLNALKMISALAILDLVIIPLLITLLHIPVEWLFITIGIVTFFGILLIANYMSGTSPFDTGEVRKALTGSFIIIYFAFVPLITFGNISLASAEPIKTIITNFTWIVGAIVIFYFGSRAVEEYIKSKN
ncbi:MAG: hypothetical protein A4E27_01225 [Methanobacterium sp. PtaU1.Bin242]|nr:MAG: hypothetical protein A4E27_01225 [Methanobacterium sp. PtaU1.Bin242]